MLQAARVALWYCKQAQTRARVGHIYMRRGAIINNGQMVAILASAFVLMAVGAHVEHSSFLRVTTGAPRIRIGAPYELVSAMANRIDAHQTNCSLPRASYSMNWAGLGSDLHVWSQALCGMMEIGFRLWAHGGGRDGYNKEGYWRWADKKHCGLYRSGVIGCYFPLEELKCRPENRVRTIENAVGHKIESEHSVHCPGIYKESGGLAEYRAAAIEYLFSKGFTPFVQEEIVKQMQLVFSQPSAPANLITVHIRWGDKKTEMELVKINAYVEAIEKILKQRRFQHHVNIFVSTEAPKAAAALRNAAPPEWSIYGDASVGELSQVRPENGNQALSAAINSKGFAGTAALASLAIAMEANEFVLTTASNWSRLINELRKNVIEPRCGKCTVMIDLRSGEV